MAYGIPAKLTASYVQSHWRLSDSPLDMVGLNWNRSDSPEDIDLISEILTLIHLIDLSSSHTLIKLSHSQYRKVYIGMQYS
jgi:hypothetical protein